MKNIKWNTSKILVASAVAVIVVVWIIVKVFE